MNQNKSIVVTPDNFHDILQTDSNHPILTLFWSPYCGHCTKFKPTWYELTEKSRYRSTIQFAEVNCVEHRNICGKYPISGYPSMLFITPSVQASVQFKGARTIQNIDKFIEIHYKYPLIVIDEGTSLKKYLDMTSNFSIFHLQYKDEDSRAFSIYHRIAERYDNYGSKFFVTKTYTTQLEVFKNVNEHFVYEGNIYDRNRLNSFISMHLFPALPQLSNSLIHDAYNNEKMVIIIFLDNKDEISVFTNAIKQINSSRCSFAFHFDKQSNQTLTKNHFLLKNINISKYPSLLLLNPQNGSYLLNTFDIPDYNKSIDIPFMENNGSINDSIQWSFNGYNSFLDMLKIRFNFMLENTGAVVLFCVLFAMIFTLSILGIIYFFIQIENPKFE